MKWFQLANVLIPIVGAYVPGFAPFVPVAMGAVIEAQQTHGADNNDVKREHVLKLVALAAQGAQDSGKVTLDPATAVAVTQAVFRAIDGVKSTIDANQHHVPVAIEPAKPMAEGTEKIKA